MAGKTTAASRARDQLQSAIDQLRDVTRQGEEFQVTYMTPKGDILLVEEIDSQEPDFLRLYCLDQTGNPCVVLGHASQIVLYATAVQARATAREPEVELRPGFNLRLGLRLG